MCGYLAVLVGFLGEGASNDCGIVDTVTDHLRYVMSLRMLLNRPACHGCRYLVLSIITFSCLP